MAKNPVKNELAAVEGMSNDELERVASLYPMLAKHRTLELNADLQPLSYKPLSTVPWTKVMFWLVKGAHRVADGGKPIVNVLEEYPDIEIRAGNESFKLPSVIAHVEQIPLPKNVAFTRFNVFLRDDFRCQYSGKKLPESQLTFDHVLPQSRGGKTTWLNIVTCSRDINEFKADRTPEEANLRLIRDPYVPTAYEIREKGRKHPPSYLHESWEDFLYWDSELEG